MTRYEPPKQSGAGQLFDSLFILVLVYASLLLPLLGVFNFGGGDEAAESSAVEIVHTWQSLGQNEAMQGQWEKLGYGPEEAATIILDRFDYTIDPLALAITAAVLIGYFLLMFRLSDKEYREVLKEKFANK